MRPRVIFTRLPLLYAEALRTPHGLARRMEGVAMPTHVLKRLAFMNPLLADDALRVRHRLGHLAPPRLALRLRTKAALCKDEWPSVPESTL